MKKLFAIVVSAAFAASSFGALAQDKPKEEVKSKQGGGVTAADKKSAVTTGTDKPKKEAGKGKTPKNLGKRKDEKERMEKK
jgi:hypothetical protein